MTAHPSAGTAGRGRAASIPPEPGPATAPTPPAAVTVTDLSVSYGDVRALVDVSLRLAPGRVHGLVGMNGSGKSTLFKALTNAADLDHATVTGTVDVDRPAYVPQSEHVDWTFPVSVRDVVTMGRRGHTGILGRPRARDRAAVDA
ncbi:metal ABC transporter ATP-binding protein, partial [Corynebacterium bovis]